MKYLLVYYTGPKKHPVVYEEGEMQSMLEEVRRMMKEKIKFEIYRIGDCIMVGT